MVEEEAVLELLPEEAEELDESELFEELESLDEAELLDEDDPELLDSVLVELDLLSVR